MYYIFLLFSKSDECKNFEENLLSLPTIASGVVSDGQQPKYDTGIFLEKISIIIKENYFLKEIKITILFKNLFFEKGLVNDSIQFINGKDLSKLKDNDIKNLLKSKKVKIIQNEQNFNLVAKEYDLYTFDLNYFLLNSIENIDTKSGEFSIDYIFKISHERPDWIEAGREIGNLTICNIAELTENSKIYSPVTNETIFIDHIKYDIDKNFSSFEQVYYKDTDKTFTDAIFSGLHIIKANFDFQRFPFDVQNLKIELEHAINLESNESGYYPKPYIGLFDIKPSVYNNIKDYKENF